MTLVEDLPWLLMGVSFEAFARSSFGTRLLQLLLYYKRYF